ncbi:dynamin family protein [Nannocystaceae bacterium ST9]
MADEQDDERKTKPLEQAGKRARAWAKNLELPSIELRSVGDALGGFARKVRDLAVEVSESVGVPEVVRDAAEQSRALRLAGEFERANELLRPLLDGHAGEPTLLTALLLTAVHERLVGDRLPSKLEILREHASRLDPKKPLPAIHLLDAVEALATDDRPDKALDALRRATRAIDKLGSLDLAEGRLLGHLLAAAAHRRLGSPDRSIREIRKAAAALPSNAGPALRRMTLTLGVDQLLADGRIGEAERWIRSAQQQRADRAQPTIDPDAEPDAPASAPRPSPPQEPSELERALLARVLAVRGEREQALALLATLPREGELFAEVRVRVLIMVGDPSAARAEALQHLQRDAAHPERLRLWALAEQRTWRAGGGPPSGSNGPVIQALVRALELAPAHGRAAQAQELAHVALLADDLSDPVQRVLAAVRRDLRDAIGEELHLHRIRAALVRARGSGVLDPEVAAEFVGPPFRLRARPELTEVLGPDELSPLRDPLRREALVAGQRQLAAAERTMLAGPEHLDAVERALVAALIEDPELGVARRKLAALTRPRAGERLEDLLAHATELLAKLPDELLGASLRPAGEALRRVIAARERLARPLTIAIMGEFSAGKSTFVNALLGEAVAPMGVLPTTNTINVFRRGTGRGARVHYRDGSIATVSAAELDAYLRNLDDKEADRIRHLEIDRVGERMGDAAVVDTPGLNALDDYHEKVAREFIEEADAVVWIFSATQGGTATEAGILRELRAGGRKVLGVLNKVDVLDSDDERRELADYLREQLGPVLVEVLPLSASAALSHRSGKIAGPDPFAHVDDALERHFLQHARELKAELTKRRLSEALILAKTTLEAAVAELESRGADEPLAAALARATAALGKFSEDLHEALLGLDDVLTREALAIGLVEAGEGVRRKVDRQDAEYLEATLEDVALRVLQDRLAALTGEHEVLAGLLVERLVPWARGYLAGLSARGFASDLISTHGRAATRGEQALRDSLRAAVRPLADDWRLATRELFRELERALARARQRSSSAPRAEALRLRTSALAGIEGLLATLEQP